MLGARLILMREQLSRLLMIKKRYQKKTLSRLFKTTMGGDGMKQGSAKKQSRTYNNNNAAQGFQGGKVSISYFPYFILF